MGEAGGQVLHATKRGGELEERAKSCLGAQCYSGVGELNGQTCAALPKPSVGTDQREQGANVWAALSHSELEVEGQTRGSGTVSERGG